MPRPSKRDQILEAARRCFYEYGINGTGVDTIAAEAEVSKRTLYNHFPSKDDLVLAYVEWRDERWRLRLARHLEGVDGPADRILAFFDAYLETPEAEDYRGCALVNAAAEIADEDSPVLAAISISKERTRAEIEALLAGAGHATPAATSVSIAALLEGSCAMGGIRRDRIDLAPLKATARTIVEAGLPEPV